MNLPSTVLARLAASLAVGFFASRLPAAETASDSFAATYPVEWLREHLQPQAAFRPAPPAHDRAPWQTADDAMKQRFIASAEQAAAVPWEVLPVTGYLDFVRDGDRARYEGVYFNRRRRAQVLAVAECIEARARFMDPLVNGLWLMCEETTWAVPAHLHFQHAGRGFPDFRENVIDLFAAETGAQLAWTCYLLRAELDRVSPLIRPRVAAEIDRRILTPFLQRDDFRWMGNTPVQLNNWTPWIVSNVLACALFVEPEPERRALIVHRALRVLDNFLAQQTPDGGCDEGPGYWSHAAGSTFDALELLYVATSGELNAFNRPLIREMAGYIRRMHIADGWFVNFADASARPRPEGSLIFRFGERTGDADLRAFGAWFARRFDSESSGGPLGRAVPGLLRSREILSAAPNSPPLPRDVWLPDLQVMAARGAADASHGLFLAALGGHNAENHNHNDVGSCVVFADGRPVLIDVGVETYSAKTFGPRRYEIWTMQSAWHNTPTINGAMQASGRAAAARDASCQADDASAVFSLDLAGAYPKEANVSRWQRTYTLTRPDRLTIVDEYALTAPGNALDWHLVFAFEPRPAGKGKLEITPPDGTPVRIEFDPDASVTIEPHDSTDPRLSAVWGERVFRVTLSRRDAPAVGRFSVELMVETSR